MANEQRKKGNTKSKAVIKLKLVESVPMAILRDIYQRQKNSKKANGGKKS